MLTLDIAAFRAQFPAFSDVVKYPDAVITGWWDGALCYLSAEDCCGCETDDCRLRAIYLLMAHLMQLASVTAAGGQAGAVQSATIDKVSVTLATIPAQSMWQWWLSGTPYGLQLYMLLRQQAGGGMYVGGAPERAALRRVGGRMR